MATVNFSVPDDVRKAFNETFEGENKSAVLAGLMRRAVEERERGKRRALAIEKLLELRGATRPTTGAAIRRARRQGRP